MRTVILGLDAFDPVMFERLHDERRLPNLAKYVDAGGYARLQVSNPAQSEVSWTSIATGANPGEHGIFDFVHRNPANYSLSVSLLPTRKSVQGTEFVRPHSAHTLFDEATDQGYPSTALWWPGTFPARRGSPVRTIPGLGTPDIRGRLGVGTFFTTEARENKGGKTPIEILISKGHNRFEGKFHGPDRRGRGPAEVRFVLETGEASAATLIAGDQSIELAEGTWSPIFEIRFRLGLAFSGTALTRVILTRAGRDPELYALPLQLHPLKPMWSYGTPPGFLKETWRACGPYLTVGWPQDTTALNEGFITDEQFLDLCDSIFEHREQAFLHHLTNFSEGVLAAVFDTLDRVQHMFWRDRPDIIMAWYEKLDVFVGKVDAALARVDNSRMLILSDHGFADFDHKVHLNRWLIDKGYLVSAGRNGAGEFSEVEWIRTKAYAIGLNSLYLNLKDRERDGIVDPEEASALKQELCDSLALWETPGGQPVVSKVVPREQALRGPLVEHGPDLLVGYTPGYRASSETGLGAWGDSAIEPNPDHWGADHCIDPVAVPGVIFSGRGLSGLTNPYYANVPELAGVPISGTRQLSPVPAGGEEDMAEVEERLRSLGYL